jgi:hypothetical protein
MWEERGGLWHLGCHASVPIQPGALTLLVVLKPRQFRNEMKPLDTARPPGFAGQRCDGPRGERWGSERSELGRSPVSP